MTAQDASRKAFEEAYIAEKKNLLPDSSDEHLQKWFLGRSGAEYGATEANAAWWAWQHQAARIAELEAQVKALQREPLSDEMVGMKAAQDFLTWNRACDVPMVKIGYEICVYENAVAFLKSAEAAHNIRAKGGE